MSDLLDVLQKTSLPQVLKAARAARASLLALEFALEGVAGPGQSGTDQNGHAFVGGLMANGHQPVAPKPKRKYKQRVKVPAAAKPKPGPSVGGRPKKSEMVESLAKHVAARKTTNPPTVIELSDELGWSVKTVDSAIKSAPHLFRVAEGLVTLTSTAKQHYKVEDED